MKNISQQLCEICGIEPKEKCKHFTGKERCLLNIPHNACICECFEQDWVYPDFEKPENLVKLLEIVYKNSIYTGTPIGSFRNAKKSFKECFFERTFKRLEKLGNSYAAKELIQAIKSEEWIYG